MRYLVLEKKKIQYVSFGFNVVETTWETSLQAGNGVICHFNPLCAVLVFRCHPSTEWTVMSPTVFHCGNICHHLVFTQTVLLYLQIQPVILML